jgi:hypothetical protein
MHHNKPAYPKQSKKFVNEFTAHKLLELLIYECAQKDFTKPMSKKKKIHEPSSYKSQHIMPASKGGRENTCYSRHKPSPNSQHNSNKKNFFQRFTSTKIIIKHPCTNKITMLCVWFVHQPKIQNGNQG